MHRGLSAVRENVRVVAARFFKGIGKDGEAGLVQRPFGQTAFLVGRLSEADDAGWSAKHGQGSQAGKGFRTRHGRRHMQLAVPHHSRHANRVWPMIPRRQWRLPSRGPLQRPLCSVSQARRWRRGYQPP
jgi:hypothetical protein